MHLIASVLFMPAGRILLVDEPQLHLHPGAEKLLAKFFRTHPEHDYVFATHSPVFVSAVEPDRAWLLTRDEHGTLITPVFEAGLPRSHVLEELGLTPGDIVLAERFLLVEGPGDVGVYPNLMRRLGWDPVRLNCSVLQLQGGDTARPLRDVVEELAALMNLPMMILLDGDKTGQIPESEVVRLLPEPDIETVFLRDPEAIRAAFDEVLVEEQLEGFDLAAWRREWTADRIAEFVSERRQATTARKGSEVLGDLAHEMGNLTYRKTVHGPRIANLMRPDLLHDVADLLQALLGPIPTP
jgi:predicted ATP-dependent endonuclease of OLD family